MLFLLFCRTNFLRTKRIMQEKGTRYKGKIAKEDFDRGIGGA